MIDLRGHAAFITGSTQGIGRAIAEAFAEAGADVILHGLRAGAEADAAVAACKKYSVRADFFAADLTEPTDTFVPKLAGQVLSVCPKPTILVNNAGSFLDVPFEEMTYDRFDRTIRLNVAAGYFLTQWFARFWQENKIAGRVLFTGSINGRLAERDSTAYDTSKGAIEMMVKTLAVSLAPKNIRVNGLAPGLVLTPLTSWFEKNPADAAWMRHHTPNGQVPPADVCGPAAVFLCSDAAAHIHGHMLLVDGGIGAMQHPPRAGYLQSGEQP